MIEHRNSVLLMMINNTNYYFIKNFKIFSYTIDYALYKSILYPKIYFNNII